MSSASRVIIRYGEEASYGGGPTGAGTAFRCTSEDIALNPSTTVSDEINSSRATVDIIRTAVAPAAKFGIEFSATSYDLFLRRLLRSADWAGDITPITGTSHSMAAADNSINDSGSGYSALVAGQWIYVSGFATAGNNGYFRIVTKANGKLTLSGGTVTNESAGPTVTITPSAYISNGTTSQSFAFTKEFSDLSNEFEVAEGAVMDAMSLNFPAQGKVTGSMDFMLESIRSATSAGWGSTAAASTTDVFTGEMVKSASVAGLRVGAMEFSWNYSNKARGRPVFGQVGYEGISDGRIEIGGTFKSYYASKTLVDYALNNTEVSLALGIRDSAGKGYVFEFPATRVTGKRPAPGVDSEVISDLTFAVKQSGSLGFMARVHRFV